MRATEPGAHLEFRKSLGKIGDLIKVPPTPFSVRTYVETLHTQPELGEG